MAETFEAFVVKSKGGPFEKVEKQFEPVPANHVRVKVHACGLCHGDLVGKMGAFPICSFPRALGHEVAGEVAELGPGSEKTKYKVGQRVGVGWYAGHCGMCSQCLNGNFLSCAEKKITGATSDGGYQRYIIADVKALVPIPDELSYEDAAPLLCAGVTVFNGLRRTNAMAGDIVGIQGIGGLGHLGIQVANKMGYKVVVFSRGEGKKKSAMELGAHVYIDMTKPTFAQEAQKLGGCKVILATGYGAQEMGDLVMALAPQGTLVVLGVPHEPVPINMGLLVSDSRKIQGHASGTAVDSDACLKFCALTGVRPINEVYPADETPATYEHMLSGGPRFRAVIKWE